MPADSMFYCLATCGSGYGFDPSKQGCGKKTMCAWLAMSGWTCRRCAGVPDDQIRDEAQDHRATGSDREQASRGAELDPYRNPEAL